MINFKLIFERLDNLLKNTYTPYSNFPVASIILTKNMEMIEGINVENVSFGLSNCAERTALFNMYTKNIKKEDVLCMFVKANTKSYISPCGACRQVISELLDLDTDIYLLNKDNLYIVKKVKDLLPFSFNSLE